MTERAVRTIARSAAALGLVAVIGTALLTLVHHGTRERIAAQERRVVEQQLGEILPRDRYDNRLLEDRYRLRDETYFPGGQAVTVYRARKNGQPVAAILRFKTARGYNGDIHLLAGIYADGTLAGVRVVSHRETPGLGDGIEARRSDWIRGFDGRSLRDPRPESWALRRDGGAFDQFTGATITPRAVVGAVRSALAFHAAAGKKLFDTPAESGEKGTP